MSFLDQLWGAAQNQLGEQQSNLAKTLLSSLGGQGAAGEANGIATLVNKFQQAGLGDAVQSWLSTEQANKEVTPDQVQQALGQHVDNMAQQTGMPKQALLVQLASMLPQVIDALTPNGQVPHGPPGGTPEGTPGQQSDRDGTISV